MRRITGGWVAAGVLLLVGSAGACQAVSGQTSTTNPYRATVGWERLPEGRTLGIVSGVIPDPDGEHLWILERCGANQCAGSDLDPILKLDLEGNLVDSFGAGLFAFPHGFALDHQGYLWVTEGGSHGDARATEGERMGMGHQVLKLSREGRSSCASAKPVSGATTKRTSTGHRVSRSHPPGRSGWRTGTGAATTGS